jgi:hypothetical protein
MKTFRHRISAVAVSTALATVLLLGGASPAAATHHSDGFNDEYVFAATRGVNDMDAHPALKMPLYPITIALDIAALPFAVIAGFVG